ncbi:hypothetical protein [Actinoplanes derwentensis]|uniref:50S ribosome-binding GTPase n=1 Tax=Actinoplanes derwentensis TaxID=113562 RepID=A0A1H1Y0K0_9ACTN|nr:hypothetical protein [Actinoplanes derwentensis]GID89784.1 hypothetical protein Ade03nite_87080 [Actinoplanes derwentensis]SDT14689.1 hypothetical protein SAMN04489716_2651 [Actinoplanes derwentensis]
MADTFKISMIGPSRVGKTTLLTAVLSETERLLGSTPVNVALGEQTEVRVQRHRRDLARAVAAGEFDAASLGGTEDMFLYEVALESSGDATMRVPFSILDYPGRWLDPIYRSMRPEVSANWPQCETHIRESLMLLVPVDAAVLMEAVTSRHKGAVADLLGFADVQAVTRRWAKARNLEEHRDEPAVLVIAPIKCERYFDDNGGTGRSGHDLRTKVRAAYEPLLDIIRQESRDRITRVVYAPIDTYGCVELMEAEWFEVDDGDGLPGLDFRGHYRFRGTTLRPKAADTVMKEMCNCIVAGQRQAERVRLGQEVAHYQDLLQRKAEDKGFWGALDYYLGGEALTNRRERAGTRIEIEAAKRRRQQLEDALAQLGGLNTDPRVEQW